MAIARDKREEEENAPPRLPVQFPSDGSLPATTVALRDSYSRLAGVRSWDCWESRPRPERGSIARRAAVQKTSPSARLAPLRFPPSVSRVAAPSRHVGHALRAHTKSTYQSTYTKEGYSRCFHTDDDYRAMSTVECRA